MKARYSILAADKHGWIPSTLELSTDSSCDTLAFLVVSLRGRGTVLAKGEFGSERCESLPRFSVPVPSGYETIVLDTARGDYRFVTVVAPEIMTAIRRLRGGKQVPGVPQGKTVGDDVWECVSCGWKSMVRGGDTLGWKGVQMSPGDSAYAYFCNKTACRPALEKAIERAKLNWGYTDTPEPAVDEKLPMPMATNKR